MRAEASDPAHADVRLPSGSAALALRLAAEAAEIAGAVAGRPFEVDADAVLAQLLLPLVVGARPPASPPRPALGGGMVHDDSSEADAGLMAALVAEGDDAEGLALRAQACFLPVTPYRAWSSPARHDTAPVPPVAVVRRDPASVRVLDLTAMWAGPLCSLLLGQWGAQVTTIEPAQRPDGLRGSPAQFAVLDRHKRRVDLDLRDGPGRAAFERLVGEADVLVESFSDRVMPNLGYGPDELRRINPRLATVAVRAYPDSDWVAYGRGVHATSGLGLLDGRAEQASIAYPDPLAGFTAFAAALGAVGAAEPPPVIRVSLAGAMAALVDGGPRPLACGDPALVGRLARATNGAMSAPIRHRGGR